MNYLKLLGVILNIIVLVTIGFSVVQIERGNQVTNKYYSCTPPPQDLMACDDFIVDTSGIPLSAQHLYNSQPTYQYIFWGGITFFLLITLSEFVYIGIKKQRKKLTRLGLMGILFLTWLGTSILGFSTLSDLGNFYMLNNGKYVYGYTIIDHALALSAIILMALVNTVIFRYIFSKAKLNNQKKWLIFNIILAVVITSTTIFAIIVNFFK